MWKRRLACFTYCVVVYITFYICIPITWFFMVICTIKGRFQLPGTTCIGSRPTNSLKKTTAMYRPVVLLIVVTFSTLVYGQGWTKYPGELTGVSGSLNYIWGVAGSKIFMYQRPCTGAWKLINGGLVQVDTDDTEVWGVASDNTIWKRPSNCV